MVLGGRIKIRGTDGEYQFNTEMKSIKDRSPRLQKEHSAYLEQIEKYSSKAKMTTHEIRSHQAQASRLVAKLVLAFSEPNLGDIETDIYLAAKYVTDNVEYLPSLPSI